MEDLRGSPLSVGTLEEMIDDNHAIVSSSVGPEYYVGVLSFVNQDLLEPGCTVLLHNKVGRHNTLFHGTPSGRGLWLIPPYKMQTSCDPSRSGDALLPFRCLRWLVSCPTTPTRWCRSCVWRRRRSSPMPTLVVSNPRSRYVTRSSWSKMSLNLAVSLQLGSICCSISSRVEQNWIRYSIRRCACALVVSTEQEIKEAVELPMTHPELYEDIGIRPPKGVILYGEPGTGKTLLAKGTSPFEKHRNASELLMFTRSHSLVVPLCLSAAVANQTSATFLRVVGSELIQKYLGDGPKLVRELFRVADDLSPSIVFIDEIDAVGSKR